VIGEKRLQRVRLIGRQSDDVGHKGLVEVQEFAAADRMFSDKRPDRVTEADDAFVQPVGSGLITPCFSKTVAKVAEIVNGLQPLQILFHALREPVIGGIAA